MWVDAVWGLQNSRNGPREEGEGREGVEREGGQVEEGGGVEVRHRVPLRFWTVRKQG